MLYIYNRIIIINSSSILSRGAKTNENRIKMLQWRQKNARTYDGGVRLALMLCTSDISTCVVAFTNGWWPTGVRKGDLRCDAIRPPPAAVVRTTLRGRVSTEISMRHTVINNNIILWIPIVDKIVATKSVWYLEVSLNCLEV